MARCRSSRAWSAGAELTGTAGITGEFDELPLTVQLCIEVVTELWTDRGGGVAG